MLVLANVNAFRCVPSEDSTANIPTAVLLSCRCGRGEGKIFQSYRYLRDADKCYLLCCRENPQADFIHIFSSVPYRVEVTILNHQMSKENVFLAVAEVAYSSSGVAAAAEANSGQFRPLDCLKLAKVAESLTDLLVPRRRRLPWARRKETEMLGSGEVGGSEGE